MKEGLYPSIAGVNGFGLAIYVVNITILLIRDRILTKEHLDFNLVNRQDSRSIRKGIRSGLLIEG